MNYSCNVRIPIRKFSYALTKACSLPPAIEQLYNQAMMLGAEWSILAYIYSVFLKDEIDTKSYDAKLVKWSETWGGVLS